jgi:hypothetical protein
MLNRKIQDSASPEKDAERKIFDDMSAGDDNRTPGRERPSFLAEVRRAALERTS